MELDDLKRRYLFATHSIEEVRSWNRRLKYFRYFRAFGGHANDSDSLDAAISYKDTNDLVAIMEQLGVRLSIFSDEPAKPVSGHEYTPSEFEAFPSIIPNTNWIKQPGHTEIFGHAVFIWCYEDRIMISPKHDLGIIDESTIAVAESIEPHLKKYKRRIIDPPRDSDHYLCGAKHPFLLS